MSAPLPRPGMYWAVHARFRAYVDRLPDGAVGTRNGASEEQGTFRFSPGPVAAEGGAPGTRLFTGEVRFGGHGGLLVVALRDPRITGTQEVELAIEHPWLADRPMPPLVIGRGVRGPDVQGSWTVTDLRMTEDGADLLGGAYPPGSPFEDIVVREATGEPRS